MNTLINGHRVTASFDAVALLGWYLASQRDKQQADVRLRVMRLISVNSEVSSRQIADEVGISNGAAYYVLTALIETGFVKLGNFKNNPRKRQHAYVLTPKGIREKSLLARSFIGRKRLEFEDLKAEMEALEEEVGMAGVAIPAPRDDQ